VSDHPTLGDGSNRQLRSHLRPGLSHRIRTLVQGARLGSLGRDVFIEPNVGLLRYPRNIHIGDQVVLKEGARICSCNAAAQIRIGARTTVGYYTLIFASERITIGDDCLIAPYAYFVDSDHGIARDQLINRQENVTRPIAVGNGVWIDRRGGRGRRGRHRQPRRRAVCDRRRHTGPRDRRAAVSAGVVILCRYGSSRLPGKILLPVAGTPILTHIVERVRRTGLPFAVATSDAAADDPIERHCTELGVPCYRGSLDDVAARFLACARSRGWSYAARINGDNLFVDAELVRTMVGEAERGDYDFVTNVPGRSYPPGTSVEVVRIPFFADLYARFTKSEHHEHVTLYLYEHPECGRRHVHENPDAARSRGLTLAIDTEADLVRAERIAAQLPAPLTDRSLGEIVAVAARL
jgi:spore coat polysaccharide biosynthesis protein SpsF